MIDEIDNMKIDRILEHLEKHPGVDFIYATKNKEVDANTRAVVCAVCGEEFIRSKKKIIGIEELNNILEKHHINDIIAIEYVMGTYKILNIDFQIVENR